MKWWNRFRKGKEEPSPPSPEFMIGKVKVRVEDNGRAFLITAASGDEENRKAVLQLVSNQLEARYLYVGVPNFYMNQLPISPAAMEPGQTQPHITLEAITQMCDELAVRFTDAESVHRHLALKQTQRDEHQKARRETYEEIQARQAINPYLRAAVRFIEEQQSGTPMENEKILELERRFMEAYRQQKKGPQEPGRG